MAFRTWPDGAGAAPRGRPVENLLRSFLFAGRGIRSGVQGERNIKVMLGAGVVALALGCWLKVPRAELGILVLCTFFVWSLELVNTALERALNRICPHRDAAIGDAKDVLAGAVLALSLGTTAVGLLLLGPPLWQRIAPLLHSVW